MGHSCLHQLHNMSSKWIARTRIVAAAGRHCTAQVQELAAEEEALVKLEQVQAAGICL